MTQATEQDELLRITEASSTQFQHSDPAGMLQFYADRHDVTLFGALGGCAVGQDEVGKILRRAASALSKGGDAHYEVLTMQVEGNLAYMVGIERIEPAAPGLENIRVTNIFRRIDGEWRLMHRHADVLKDSPFA